MWVPPCDCGVKPMPPKPASRPECISTSVTSAAEISTCRTAKNGTIAAGSYQRYSAAPMATPDDARATIQRLLVTGDNRLKQGVALEKVRESYLAALEAAREAGLEEAVRPLVELRLADLETSSKQKLLHPLRLPPDVVRLGGAAARRGSGAAAAPPRRARRRARRRRAGRRGRRPPAARTRAGRRRASRRPSGPTRAPRASRARTARRGSAGRRRPRRRSTPRRDRGRRAREVDPGRPSSAGRSGPSPTKASAPSPRRSKARARPQHVLALAQRADAEEAGSRRRPADLGAGRRDVAQREPLEVDAAVDHRALRPAPPAPPRRGGRGASARPRRRRARAGP